MLTTARLIKFATDGHAVFDRRGDPVNVDVPSDIGEAALLVSAVTDAVKKLENGVVESMDRDDLWVVEAIVLRESVLRRLDAGFTTAEELMEAVRDLGYTWQVSPVSGP